jgi:hypothetical protein
MVSSAAMQESNAGTLASLFVVKSGIEQIEIRHSSSQSDYQRGQSALYLEHSSYRAKAKIPERPLNSLSANFDDLFSKERH